MQEEEQPSIFDRLFDLLTTSNAIYAIIFVGILVFFNSLFNNFVWDDKSYLLNNSGIHSFNLLKAFTQNLINGNGFFRPMYYIYFSLLYPLFQDTTFFYHFIQISIHIANSILLYLFFKKILNKNVAFFISLIFLVHPIQVESVVFISGVLNPLFSMFGLFSLILLQKNQLTSKGYLAIGIFLFLSLITYEGAILYVFITFLFCLFFKKNYLRVIAIIDGAVLIIYGLIRLISGNINLVNPYSRPIQSQNFFGRLIDIPAIIFYYLKIFFFPKDMAIWQLWIVKKIDLQNFYLPLFLDFLFFLAVGLTGFYIYRKNKKTFVVFGFFLIWFLVGLLVHLQLFPLDMTVADRWFYFPIVGLLGMGGCMIQSLKTSSKNIKDIAYLLCFIILIFLSFRTIVRNTDWYDDITLLTHDSQIQDNNLIEAYLGTDVYFSNNNYTEALKHMKKSLKMLPNEAIFHDIGKLYQATGNLNEAKKYYEESINTNYYPEKTHKLIVISSCESLATISLATDSPEISAQRIKTCLHIFPDSANLWQDFAISEYKMNKQQEALSAIAKARSLSHTAMNNSLYLLMLNHKSLTAK